MPRPRALITGITGQDGSYLAELLLEKGYEVHGMVRRIAIADQEARWRRIAHLLDDITLHSASMESFPSILRLLSGETFDECYHLAAQSSVAESFSDSFSTMNVNINGTHYMLAALQQFQPSCRFCFAGSSEMFGKVDDSPQRETTRFNPRSPYGISKVTGYELTRNYRDAYGMFCCSGILFNHESPRRGEEFVSRKITSGAARIKAGQDHELRLGNLDARRDWGHSRDYVRGMHMMLQHSSADDFVFATGSTHSVREFCKLAFAEVGLDYQSYVKVDPKFFRPTEADALTGDYAKARTTLGWEPTVSFEQLVKEMVQEDCAATKAQ